MPDTLIGLLVALAGVAPGYIFVRQAERREPRRERSTLLEAAEMLLIGGSSTAVSILLVLSLAQAISYLDLPALLEEPTHYFGVQPQRVLVAGCAVLAVSYSLSWVAATLIFRGRPPNIHPNYSVWRAVISEASRTSGDAMAALEMKDGRVVSGFVHSYTLDPDSDVREIALKEPIYARTAGSAPVRIETDYLIVPGEALNYLSVQKVT